MESFKNKQNCSYIGLYPIAGCIFTLAAVRANLIWENRKRDFAVVMCQANWLVESANDNLLMFVDSPDCRGWSMHQTMCYCLSDEHRFLNTRPLLSVKYQFLWRALSFESTSPMIMIIKSLPIWNSANTEENVSFLVEQPAQRRYTSVRTSVFILFIIVFPTAPLPIFAPTTSSSLSRCRPLSSPRAAGVWDHTEPNSLIRQNHTHSAASKKKKMPAPSSYMENTSEAQNTRKNKQKKKKYTE